MGFRVLLEITSARHRAYGTTAARQWREGTDEMVWGVVQPSGFGDFRPEGNFVGWEERLDAYYHKELADGPLKAHMPRASFYRSRVLWKFLYELGKLIDGLRVERPLPHE